MKENILLKNLMMESIIKSKKNASKNYFRINNQYIKYIIRFFMRITL